MNEILIAVLPALIGLVSTIVGLVWAYRHPPLQVHIIDGKAVSPEQLTTPSTPTRGQQVVSKRSRLKIGAILTDTGIIFLLTAIYGFLVGWAAIDRPYAEFEEILGLTAIVTAVLAFTIIGSRNATNRWLHLCAVAVVAWFFSVYNLFLGSDLQVWLYGLPLTLVTMLIGGGLSYLFTRRSA